METALLLVAGLTLIAHIFLAFFATLEAKEYPLYGLRKRLLMLALIWGIPIIGTLVAHRAMNIGWAKGSGGAGDVTTGGHSGGDGGCDGGGC